MKLHYGKLVLCIIMIFLMFCFEFYTLSLPKDPNIFFRLGKFFEETMIILIGGFFLFRLNPIDEVKN